MAKGHIDTFATIEEIVDGVCLDLGEGNHRKEQYLHWAIKEIERWNMDMAKEVKTIEVSMTPWKSIKLPKDCIDWTKIGVQAGNMIKTFVNSNKIALLNKLDEQGVKIYNDEPTEDQLSLDNADVDGSYLWPFYNYNKYGEDPGRLFGMVVKDNGFGYFTEHRDPNINEIQFKSRVVPSTAKIYLEYLSNGFSPNRQSLVHPYAKELITLGIHYRRLLHNKNETEAAKERMKDEYFAEMGRVIDRMWNYTTEDVVEYMLSGYQLTPKR